MAKLSDKDKAAAILGDVEDPKDPAETTKPTDAEVQDEPDKPEDAEEIVEDESDEEKPHEDENETKKPADSTFTKQFPNLNGETPEEYLPELEKAYDNSFKEALRLNDVIKEKDKIIQDNNAIVDQARQIVARTQQPVQQDPANPAQPVAPALPNPVADSPELQWIRDERRRVMQTAFDEFKTEYPQVLDQQEFDKFSKASDGLKTALAASNGREPTDLEVFRAVAGSFGWQPAKNDAKKNAAIKENASIGRTQSNQAPARPRPAKVSDAQVDTYMKMFTGKTREDAVKELSEVV